MTFLGRAVARAPTSGFFLFGPTATKTHSSQSVTVSLLSKRPSLFCLIHFRDTLGAAWGRRHPSIEDDLQWKTTINGRRPSMEDDLRWKTTFDGRQPLLEHNLRWKTSLDGRRASIEDKLRWKTSFDGRQPLMGDDLQWKTTFDGR